MVVNDTDPTFEDFDAKDSAVLGILIALGAFLWLATGLRFLMVASNNNQNHEKVTQSSMSSSSTMKNIAELRKMSIVKSNQRKSSRRITPLNGLKKTLFLTLTTDEQEIYERRVRRDASEIFAFKSDAGMRRRIALVSLVVLQGMTLMQMSFLTNKRLFSKGFGSLMRTFAVLDDDTILNGDFVGRLTVWFWIAFVIILSLLALRAVKKTPTDVEEDDYADWKVLLRERLRLAVFSSSSVVFDGLFVVFAHRAVASVLLCAPPQPPGNASSLIDNSARWGITHAASVCWGIEHSFRTVGGCLLLFALYFGALSWSLDQSQAGFVDPRFCVLCVMIKTLAVFVALALRNMPAAAFPLLLVSMISLLALSFGMQPGRGKGLRVNNSIAVVFGICAWLALCGCLAIISEKTTSEEEEDPHQWPAITFLAGVVPVALLCYFVNNRTAIHYAIPDRPLLDLLSDVEPYVRSVATCSLCFPTINRSRECIDRVVTILGDPDELKHNRVWAACSLLAFTHSQESIQSKGSPTRSGYGENAGPLLDIMGETARDFAVKYLLELVTNPFEGAKYLQAQSARTLQRHCGIEDWGDHTTRLRVLVLCIMEINVFGARVRAVSGVARIIRDAIRESGVDKDTWHFFIEQLAKCYNLKQWRGVKDRCFDLSARTLSGKCGGSLDLASLMESSVLIANRHWSTMGKRGFGLMLNLAGEIVRDGLIFTIEPSLQYAAESVLQRIRTVAKVKGNLFASYYTALDKVTAIRCRLDRLAEARLASPDHVEDDMHREEMIELVANCADERYLAACVAHCAQKGYFADDEQLKYDMIESRGFWVNVGAGGVRHRRQMDRIVNIRRHGDFVPFEDEDVYFARATGEEKATKAQHRVGSNGGGAKPYRRSSLLLSS